MKIKKERKGGVILNNSDIEKSSFTLKKIMKIYSICLSVLIGITGILFVAAVSHLYFTGGDNPYSRERVGTYLKTIIIPIILTVLGVLAGAVLSVINDIKEKGPVGKPDPIMAKRALERIFDAEGEETVLNERKKQRTIVLITAIASLVILAVSLVFAILIPEHAIVGLNGHVVMATLIMTPSAVIVISGIYAASRVYLHSCEAELCLMKAKIKENPSKKKAPEVREFLTRGRLLGIRGAVLALALVFIVLGISNGGMKDVFAKAVAICTECIGLG